MKVPSRERCLWILVGAVVVLIPIALSSVTYTFISVGSDPISLDDIQGLILSIALMKMILLGSTGVFPIDLDKLFGGKQKRSINSNSIMSDTETLYKVPAVAPLPCTRRFLCELEAAARTSDRYEECGPKALNNRNPEDEVAPEEVDPLTEMHIEAVKAFYRENNPTGDLTASTSRALGLMEGLTSGKSCEQAYKLCPGRYTGPMIFKLVFDEMNYSVHDEL